MLLSGSGQRRVPLECSEAILRAGLIGQRKQLPRAALQPLGLPVIEIRSGLRTAH